MDVEIPDWAREGERVAIREGSLPRYTMDVIDRITATQVVLANGRRFRLASLREAASGRGQLVDRRDEAVKTYRVKHEIQRYAMKIEDIAKQLRNGRELGIDDALNQMGASQRQMEKMIYRIAEDKLS